MKAFCQAISYTLVVAFLQRSIDIVDFIAKAKRIVFRKYIDENTEGYKAVTAEQRAQKAIWEDIIADISSLEKETAGLLEEIIGGNK